MAQAPPKAAATNDVVVIGNGVRGYIGAATEVSPGKDSRYGLATFEVDSRRYNSEYGAV
jgi:hypothetical protein